MGPALSCHRTEMKLLETFPGNGLKVIYHDREPELTTHHLPIHMALVPWLTNQKFPIYSANSPRIWGGNYKKKKRTHVTYWGFALEHNKVRHGGKMFFSLQES